MINFKSNRIDKDRKVTIPYDICNEIGLIEDDIVEIFIKNNTVCIKKSIESCIFCGSIMGLKKIKGKCICKSCLDLGNKMEIEDISF